MSSSMHPNDGPNPPTIPQGAPVTQPPTPENELSTSRGSCLVALLVSVLFLAVGIGGAVTLVKMKPTPKQETAEKAAPLVEVAVVEVATRPIVLNLQGRVQAAKQVMVMPEVGGRIVWQHENLVPGGFIKKGEKILRIDPRDYHLALLQQKAQLESQRLALKVEKGRGDVAEKEWEAYQKERELAGLPATPRNKKTEALALRKPHQAAAKASLSAAKNAISQAQIRLGRTAVGAPFNAFVQMESSDVGQLVGPQSQLATLVGTDRFWIQISVPLDRLNYVRVPSAGSKEPGSEAIVSMDVGKERITKKGYVIRLLGDLDPLGRMARLIVEIEDPFGLKTKKQKGVVEEDDSETSGPPKSDLPLLLGAYVQVRIDGEAMESVAEVPRRAVRGQNSVFIVDKDNNLQARKVTIAWGTEDTVLVTKGLKTGDRVMLTALGTATDGMHVRLTGESAKAAPSAAPPGSAKKP